jgi:hypothetical protein
MNRGAEYLHSSQFLAPPHQPNSEMEIILAPHQAPLFPLGSDKRSGQVPSNGAQNQHQGPTIISKCARTLINHHQNKNHVCLRVPLICHSRPQRPLHTLSLACSGLASPQTAKHLLFPDRDFQFCQSTPQCARPSLAHNGGYVGSRNDHGALTQLRFGFTNLPP